MMDERIEAYLDDLTNQLAGRTPDVRRVVTEIEAHLYEAIDEGCTPKEAIARAGAPAVIARRYRAALWRQLAFLGAVGLLAIGASGALAGLMRALWGDRFVAGDANGVTYTVARCGDFLRAYPHAGSCAAAAATHHSFEVVAYRLGAGVLGLVVLVVAGRRVRPGREIAAGGALLFGVAAAALAVQAVAQLHDGGGQWLSAAVVAAAVAAAFGQRLLTASTT